MKGHDKRNCKGVKAQLQFNGPWSAACSGCGTDTDELKCFCCDTVCCNDYSCLREHDKTYPKDDEGNDTKGWAFWLPPWADDEKDDEFVCAKCWDDYGKYLATFSASNVPGDDDD